MAMAQTYKDVVVETLKQKRSDATAIDIQTRTKALWEANQIAVLEQSSGQRQKQKKMDGFVVESTCGADNKNGERRKKEKRQSCN